MFRLPRNSTTTRLLTAALIGTCGVAVIALALRATGPARAARGYPPIVVPADNPMSAEKALLGRWLFYDRRLSVNGSVACADCHRQEFAFADPRERSIGATGELTRRNAMSLTNVVWNGRYTWADDSVTTLEQQARAPLLQEHPIEMGMGGHEREILDRIAGDHAYAPRFAGAFPDAQGAVTLDLVVKALAAFQRTLVSVESPYDRFLLRDADAFSESAQRGFRLFRSSRLMCAQCHGGFNFRMTEGHRTGPDDDSVAYHNTGLYDVDGRGAYPDEDRGLIDATGRPEDMGRFKAPTLRNIAVTGPYMHDGSVATLEEAIAHYAAGGRHVTSGPHAGDGRRSRYKSHLITGFTLTPGEQADLLAFLESLTDRTFLSHPGLSNPFTGQR
jgi:cytochrome c peroxidase